MAAIVSDAIQMLNLNFKKERYFTALFLVFKNPLFLQLISIDFFETIINAPELLPVLIGSSSVKNWDKLGILSIKLKPSNYLYQ